MTVFPIAYLVILMFIIEIDKGQTKVKTIVNFSTTLLTFKGGYNMDKFEKQTKVTWFPSENIDILSSNIELEEVDIIRPKDKAIYTQLEQAFSNGIVWETSADDFVPSLELEKTFYNEAITHRNNTTTKKSLEEVLATFDSWVGTPIDILSPYGDIDFGNNIFADNFAMDVPVKIYSEKDDLVFKVDAPWMKVEAFDDVDLYPSQLNLKSVLSMLPVTVNSKELKASFVDGEFRLEVPKNEISVGQERKKG